MAGEVLRPEPMPAIGGKSRRKTSRECLPAWDLINTGRWNKGLDIFSSLCHRQMDASAQPWRLLRSGERTGTEGRVSGGAVGTRAGRERTVTEATGRSAAGQQAKCRAVFQRGSQA